MKTDEWVIGIGENLKEKLSEEEVTQLHAQLSDPRSVASFSGALTSGSFSAKVRSVLSPKDLADLVFLLERQDRVDALAKVLKP